MDFTLRAPTASDLPALHQLRCMEGVFENTLALPTDRETSVAAWFNGLDDDTHIYVAEVQEEGGGKVIGFAGLQVYGGRRRHVGGVGITVHKEYQGKGVGRALMVKLLDLADHWLLLKRVELEVYADNPRAILLYESLGFVQEGVRACAAIKAGEYADEVIMGRIALTPEERRILRAQKETDSGQLNFPGV